MERKVARRAARAAAAAAEGAAAAPADSDAPMNGHAESNGKAKAGSSKAEKAAKQKSAGANGHANGNGHALNNEDSASADGDVSMADVGDSKVGARHAAANAAPRVVKPLQTSSHAGWKRKSYYSPAAAVKALTVAQVEQMRRELGITVQLQPIEVEGGLGSSSNSARGEKKKNLVLEMEDIWPISSFAQTGLSAQILECTKTFTKPTPIQAQVWPAILSGNALTLFGTS